jgi:hypothetical protein
MSCPHRRRLNVPGMRRSTEAGRFVTRAQRPRHLGMVAGSLSRTSRVGLLHGPGGRPGETRNSGLERVPWPAELSPPSAPRGRARRRRWGRPARGMGRPAGTPGRRTRLASREPRPWPISRRPGRRVRACRHFVRPSATGSPAVRADTAPAGLTPRGGSQRFGTLGPATGRRPREPAARANRRRVVHTSRSPRSV